MSQQLSPTLDLQADFGAPDPALWRSLTEKVLGGVPFDKKLVVKTPEGIPVQPIYGPDALDGLDLADTTPGRFPYVRGTKAEGYRSGAWQICQRLPYPTAEEFNVAAKRDLSRGQDALMLQFDRVGRQGLDPADRAGEGGTAISTQADFDAAVKDLDLAAVAVHVDAGVSAPAAAQMLFSQAAPPSEGSVLFDPVALLATEGYLPMTLDRAWDLLANHLKMVDTHAPAFKSVGVDVSWSGNAGGHAVFDLACMLASAAESFRALEERGVSPDLAAGKAMVRFSVGTDFFMEIAKFRAARGLWAHFVRACGGSEDSAKLTQHAQTSIWEQSALDPYVNLLRATSEAFSAVVGGVDGLTVDPFDAVFGLPNEFSRRIARNIQLVLRDEAHLTEVVDPAGGSWLVETLTQELSKNAWALFQEMEAQGGLIAMLRDGSLREDLLKIAEDKKLKLSRRQDVKVGVNQYANLDEKAVEIRTPAVDDLAHEAKKRIGKLKATRDETEVRNRLKALSAETLPAMPCQVLNQGATLGEVMEALGAKETTRAVPVKTDRLTAGYERLRENMALYVAEHGAAPKIYMAQMGPVKQHKIRSDFSVEFLKPSGFEIIAEGSHDDAESAAAAAVASGAAATVICSTDDTYPELVPAFAKAVKAANPKVQVIMAGLMPDHVEAFKAAGVDEFIHLRANNLQLLSDLQALTGVAQ
ncbi:MAG: acyl-CoA mutase large subunit family protein [Verrucomicrobia bacterium]|nr:acyl-CoA mutase large subunit family protein [Verrucomicrobiota bacterium]MCH8526122.1 acyl-CoA mutase large subunit family protein [Kiritimatiellia bacterium]